MTDPTILNELLQKGTVAQVLTRGSNAINEIKAFKQMLYQLGFDDVKDQTTQQINGEYGDATVACVKDFCQKNGKVNDGETITTSIAQLIQSRYELLGPMLELYQHLQNNSIGDIYYQGSPHKDAIIGLQKLLKVATGSDTDISGNSGNFDADTLQAIKALTPSTGQVTHPTDHQAAVLPPNLQTQTENPQTNIPNPQTSETTTQTTNPQKGNTNTTIPQTPTKKPQTSIPNPQTSETTTHTTNPQKGNANATIPQTGDARPTTSATPQEGKTDSHHGFLHFCSNFLGHFGKHKEIAHLLQVGKGPHPYIKDLQKSLHLLGFGKELGQTKEKLDGKFGDGLIHAIKSFAQKNGIRSDGKHMTTTIAKAMHHKLDALPFMHQLQRDLREGTIEQKYHKDSKAKIAIGALQFVLKELGHGKQLKWNQKANDGHFGENVVKALKSHFKLGFFHDLTGATPNMIFSLLKDIGKGFGDHWKDHVKTLSEDKDAILSRFTASNFIGKPVIANVAFIPSLKKINVYARKNNVKIYVTNSFRPADTHLKDTIVKPAFYSNHKVGHAIDMNLQYEGDGGKLADHIYMSKTNSANWAPSVKGFLDDITDDPFLRWGGNFHTDPDPVHIDDNFNHNHTVEEFNKELQLVNQAYENNEIQSG